MSKRIISIVGPTASGKTALSVLLAQHFDTEIISADSRQFYKEMNIGTAVPEPAELAMAKHHLIQHKSIFDNYSVGDFERDFLSLTKQIFKSKDTIILVGGSGLFIDVACKGLDKLPSKNIEIRKRLTEDLQKYGIEKLQKEMLGLDADFYQIMDNQNPHRLIRSIEILLQSKGKKMLEIRNNNTQKRNFDCIYIGLNTERPLLYDRINKRVDMMIEKGLIDEAKKLYPYSKQNALNTVGYKELFRYFDDEIDLEFAISEIKKNTRRFAKRQLTWFRKNKSIKWFDIAYNFDEILDSVRL